MARHYESVPKLTKARRDRLFYAISKGATYRLAAQYAGIAPETLSRWMCAGRQEGAHEKLVHLLECVEAAEARFAMRCLEAIDKASQVAGQWQAAQTILERRFPDEYGRRQTLQLENTTPRTLSEEEAERIMAARRKLHEEYQEKGDERLLAEVRRIAMADGG